MKQSATKKGLASKKETVEKLNEEQLNKQLEESRLKRQAEAIIEIEEVLKRKKCVMSTDIRVVLNNNRVVKPVVVALP